MRPLLHELGSLKNLKDQVAQPYVVQVKTNLTKAQKNLKLRMSCQV